LASEDRVALPVYALVCLVGRAVGNGLTNNSSCLVATPNVASGGRRDGCGSTNAAHGRNALPGNAFVGLVGGAVGGSLLDGSSG